MGYIKNHSIIVNSWDEKSINAAHSKAMDLFPELTTEIKETPINEDYSFAILPDGSKEGWEDSDRYDNLRDQFKKWIKTKDLKDGSNPIKWVEVWFDEQGDNNTF